MQITPTRGQLKELLERRDQPLQVQDLPWKTNHPAHCKVHLVIEHDAIKGYVVERDGKYYPVTLQYAGIADHPGEQPGSPQDPAE